MIQALTILDGASSSAPKIARIDRTAAEQADRTGRPFRDVLNKGSDTSAEQEQPQTTAFDETREDIAVPVGVDPETPVEVSKEWTQAEAKWDGTTLASLPITPELPSGNEEVIADLPFVNEAKSDEQTAPSPPIPDTDSVPSDAEISLGQPVVELHQGTPSEPLTVSIQDRTMAQQDPSRNLSPPAALPTLFKSSGDSPSDDVPLNAQAANLPGMSKPEAQKPPETFSVAQTPSAPVSQFAPMIIPQQKRINERVAQDKIESLQIPSERTAVVVSATVMLPPKDPVGPHGFSATAMQTILAAQSANLQTPATQTGANQLNVLSQIYASAQPLGSGKPTTLTIPPQEPADLTKPVVGAPFGEMQLGSTHREHLVATTPARADPALPAPPNAAAIGAQLLEAVRVRTGNSVEVTLNPEELGRVRMGITTHDTTMVIAISADKPETMDLMRRNMEQLARNMMQLGYAEVSIEFGTSNNSSGFSKDESTPGNTPLKVSSSQPEQVPQPISAQTATAPGGLDLRM